MSDSLSIIIVNYKSWDKLKLCLDSISKQKDIKISTIVVDNNSNDHQIINFKNKFVSVKWIENSENLGFAKACNIGASYCNSTWYLFLNPDTILKEDSLSTLISYCNTNTEHKLIGIKQLNEKLVQTNSFGIFLNFWSISGLLRPIIRFLKRMSYSRINSQLISHPDWISGSFILTRKQDFELINGWDESYWMYYEDMDLCKRAKENNLQVSLFNNWDCTHFHGISSRKNNIIKVITKSEVIISSHIYIEKHSNNKIAFVTHLLLILIQLVELLLSFPFSSIKRKILLNSLKYWRKGIIKSDWRSQREISSH